MIIIFNRLSNSSKSVNILKKIEFIKRFHILSNNKQKRFCNFKNGSVFSSNKNNSLNSYYVQQSSFHSFFETYVSAFQALSNSNAVAITQQFLVNIHDNTGLPWWGTIVVSTIFLRGVITLPLSLYQQYILAKVENLKTELPPIVKELQHEVTVASKMYEWSPATATSVYQRSLKKQWNILIERDNCHPAKASIIVLFQLPMWVLLSMSLRNLVSMRPYKDEAAVEIFSQMEHEGLLWVPNLTLPDDTMITSTLICLVGLSIVEINRLMYLKEPSKLKSVVVNTSRAFALITFPFALIVPSCISFYWLASTTFGLVQNLILMSPRLKSLAGIPQTPTTLQHPYKHLWKQLLSRMKIEPKSI